MYSMHTESAGGLSYGYQPATPRESGKLYRHAALQTYTSTLYKINQ